MGKSTKKRKVLLTRFDFDVLNRYNKKDKKTERKIYEQKLIDIKLIENFAVEMDKSVAKKDINKNYD